MFTDTLLEQIQRQQAEARRLAAEQRLAAALHSQQRQEAEAVEAQKERTHRRRPLALLKLRFRLPPAR